MANEVSITTIYGFANDGLTLRGSNSFTYSITGYDAMGTVQTLSGASVPVAFNGLPNSAFLFLCNQSVSSYASISLNSGQTQVLSILGPSQSLVMPTYGSPFSLTGGTGYWASGVSGQAVQLQVIANQF